MRVLIILSLLAWQIMLTMSNTIKVTMPGVVPKKNDSYLCTKFKLDEERPLYLTEFEPLTKKGVAHHMIVFSCEDVIDEEVWNCGEMEASEAGSEFKKGPICKEGTQSILYAWAHSAPKLLLPKDVGFKVGGQTEKKYIVLQVHYANVNKIGKGEKDHSGVEMTGVHKPLPNLAGVFLLLTGGMIRAHHSEHFEAACQMQEEITIVPFAYRTHAHKLGIVNSGYLVKIDELTGKQKWIELGRRSPQLPQMFFPINKEIKIGKGDILTSRCTMNNTLDHDVFIGPTTNDEMCNFYIMYYVKGADTLEENSCFTIGPPNWYFQNFRTLNDQKLDMKQIPKSISVVPKDQVEELAHMNNLHS